MSGVVWLAGALLSSDEARIDPADRGLLLGDGLFETMRASRGGVLRLSAHRARLESGAAELGIPTPLLDWEAAIGALLAANGLAEAAVRLSLTRGMGARGIAPPEPCAPTLLITGAPLPAPAAPARLCIARTTCRNERSPLSRLKTLNYLDGIVARREALARGFDDAVLLNTAGRVAEATAANLFALVDGRWLTPPVADGALPGVARAEVLAAGQAVEAELWPEDLARAEAITLTNALGMRAVSEVEGLPLSPPVRLPRH